ncbi:MAG TPA: PLP-dependent aminotransferase family protein [Thermoanaerobaculia bacterium]|nr:PLP-dependent aminotransferase family protein [Thermoanaerobaculia bacterium]
MTSAAPSTNPSPLYLRISDNLTQQMASGALRAGDRVPSLRQLSRQMRVSITTALQAYLWLESRGYLESKPRSGFFVRTPFARLIPIPQFESRKSQPTEVSTDAVLSDIISEANDSSNIPFGVACASPETFPTRKLNLILRRIIRERPHHSARYEFGSESLRRQIARRSLSLRCGFSPDEVTITSGGLEAINLALRAVAKPGDVIAVESPTFFGILGSAASLNMKVVEIPTHPQEGMDLDELERAIRRHHVKACIAMSNCHNPLGYVLPDRVKKTLVELTGRHGVAIIEDDVYGDLTYSGSRPAALKAFDRHDLVLLCSSFSKVLSPGYRIGWVAAGRFQKEVERLKFLTTVATPSLSQLVIAEFLESGGYDRHVRRMQSELARQADLVRHATASHFPEGTRITRPAGGHMLWIELPPRVNAMKLYRAALDRHISILPGPIFSATGRFKNYIRINSGSGWSPAYERALMTLGRLCERAVD